MWKSGWNHQAVRLSMLYHITSRKRGLLFVRTRLTPTGTMRLVFIKAVLLCSGQVSVGKYCCSLSFLTLASTNIEELSFLINIILLLTITCSKFYAVRRCAVAYYQPLWYLLLNCLDNGMSYTINDIILWIVPMWYINYMGVLSAHAYYIERSLMTEEEY